MFIKISKRVKDGKTYKTIYLAEWYRENGKVKHKHLYSFKNLTEYQILWLQNIFWKQSKNTFSDSKDIFKLKDLKIIASKQYWNITVFSKIFDEHFKWILSQKHYSNIRALLINRIFEPQSKSWLNNRLKLVDLPTISNKNSIYDTVDYLNSEHTKIEDKLFKKNKDQNCDLLLYDITSTYFEWTKCEIAKYGYSRDHRWDRKQVNIWLVTNSFWCPITTEIIEWNINDKSTVKDKIDKLKTRFWIKKVTFVFDRWMKTKINLEYIKEQWFEYITALDHAELKEKAMKNQDVMQWLFDKQNLAEYSFDNKKHVLSYNEQKAYKDKNDRLILVDRTKKRLQKIQNLKRNYSLQTIQDKVSKTINKDKCSKYISYKIIEFEKDWKKYWKLEFEDNTEMIEKDELYDWFYMVESTITEISKEELESKYKSLQLVERSFDEVKNLIELRPIFHWKTDRVKWHIFACFLSYYLLFHFKQKVQELLKNNTLDKLLTELKCISKSYVEIRNLTFSLISELTPLQKSIFEKFNL
jgi:transposase